MNRVDRRFSKTNRLRFLPSFTLLFISCLLSGLPALCVGLPSVHSTNKPDIVTSKVATFTQLNINEGVKFNRTKSEYTFHFPFPQHWHCQPGSALILNLSHSSALIPLLSNLRIDLNDIPLGNVVLDQKNIEPTDIVIPFNQDDLKEWNQITLRISQHYSAECEDAFSSCLWTSIGLSSRIIFNIKQDRPTLNLQNWPYPIMDVRTVTKEKVHFVLAARPDAFTLQAMARIAASLGNFSDVRKLEITNGADPEANNIVVGTPAENHAIVDLASKLPLPINTAGKFVDQSGIQIADDSGVIELIDNDKGQITLIVSGNSPQGVDKAAAALTEDEINPILGGQAAIVEKLELPGASAPVSRPNQMPSETSFTLAQLGYSTQTVRGLCPEPIKVDCNTIAGIQAIGDSQKIRIVYGYGAQLNTQLSSLEVKLNGVSLRSYTLDQNTGEEHHVDLLSVPNYLFNPGNRLEFNFHLYPKQTGYCTPKNDEYLWGTLYEDTSIIIDREYVVGLPDLSLLNDFGYPFINKSGLSDLLMVMPANIDPATVLSLVKLSFLFGQWSDMAQNQLNVTYDNALTDIAREKNNLIVFSPNGQNTVQKALAKSLTLNNEQRLIKILNTEGKKHLTVKELEANGYMEAIINPWNKNKNILVLSGFSPPGFALAVSALTNSQLRYKLGGSLASISAEGIVKHLQATLPVIKSTIAPWRLFSLWLSQYLWLGPLLLVILLLFLIPKLLKAVRSD